MRPLRLVTADSSTLIGYLESPREWYPRSTSVAIAGWVFSATSPVCAVEVVVDGTATVPLHYGLARADVRQRYGTAGSDRSGFAGTVPIVASGNGHAIRVECFAILEDGRRLRWLDRTVRLYDGGLAARIGRVGTVVSEALQSAVRARRLPPQPQTWPATIWRHWRGVPAAAIAQQLDPAPFDRQRFEASFRRAYAMKLASRHPPMTRPTADAADVVSLPRDADDVLPLCDPQGFWLPPGPGEYVVLLDSTTVPTSDGPSRVTQAIINSRADWVYTDDCRRDARGEICDPYLKGAFSHEQALFDDYATRLAIGRRAAIARIGGLNVHKGEAAIHDLVLRLAASGATVHHHAEICAYRASPIAPVPSALHLHAAEQSLHADAGPAIRVEVGRPRSPLACDLPRAVWPDDALDAMTVTIVIPTRDSVALLRRCIDGLRRTVEPARTKLLIVDDRSRDRATLTYFEQLQRQTNLRCAVTRPPDVDGRFNYARLMNYAAEVVDTPLMLHLNNDVEAIEPRWLDQMAGWMTRPQVAVVGAKLLFHDGSLQHAGVAVSPSNGVPEHLFRRLMGGDAGYQWLPHRARNVSAVTGACLLTRTALYRELGGFDATHLPVQFNDIDYCLRAAARGYRIVFEPAAVLYHEESASRGRAFDYRENAHFIATHHGYREPFVSAQFEADSLFGSTLVVTASP